MTYKPITVEDLALLRAAGFGGLPVNQWYVLLHALDEHMKFTGNSYPTIWHHINHGDFDEACTLLALTLRQYGRGLEVFDN